MDGSVGSSELFPPGYNVYRKDRDLHGGGVCIVVSSKLKSSQCTELDTDCEAIWIKVITSDNSPVYVCSYYRPPGSPVDTVEMLRKPLGIVNARHRKKPPFVVICGDLNYPLIDWDAQTAPSNREGQGFLDIVSDYHLHQMVRSVTRYGNSTDSLLDLVITSYPDLVQNLIVGRELSDHCLVSFQINKKVATIACTRRKIYLFDKANYQKIQADLQQFQTDFFASSPEKVDVNEIWAAITAAIQKTVEKNVPTKYSSSKPRPLWLNKKISRLIRKRNHLANIAKKTGSFADRERYKQLRNLTSKAISTSYTNYLNEMIGDVKLDTRRFFKYIKSQRVDSTGLTTLTTANGAVSDNLGMATHLNNYFSSVFTKENAQALPNLTSSFPEMESFTVSENGVLKLLLSIDPKKSGGPDSVPSRILKESATQITPMLTYLFNRTLDDGEIPREWKLANVFALHKQGPRDEVTNYRPISLTCVCCKIMEHIMCSNMARFLGSHNVLTLRRHGFRPYFGQAFRVKRSWCRLWMIGHVPWIWAGYG